MALSEIMQAVKLDVQFSVEHEEGLVCVERWPLPFRGSDLEIRRRSFSYRVRETQRQRATLYRTGPTSLPTNRTSVLACATTLPMVLPHLVPLRLDKEELLFEKACRFYRYLSMFATIGPQAL